MAGHRGGGGDALARACGARHRALLDVGGVPMLVRVLRALLGARGIGRIVVSIGEPDALEAEPLLAELLAEGRLETHRSLDSPSRSALDLLDRLGDAGPLLVTTADHPLLTAEIVDHFAAEAERGAADVAFGAVAGSLVRARYPSSVRTWVRLADGDWSGANLFALRTPAARRAVEFWTRVDRLRKRPWRLVSAFGPSTLALFALRRLDLASGLERVSRRIGARVQLVALPFAEAAIDVDRLGDLELVTRILREGRSQA
jgi:GTP:adenosylcobinamide-phosphate guanylyltransferase